MVAETELVYETEHLKIYPYHQQDFKDLSSLLSNPLINNALGMPEFSSDFSKVKNFLNQIYRQKNNNYRWLLYSIYQKNDNRLIGGCGFKVDLIDSIAEIFFMLYPEEWGKGFMTEALYPLLNIIHHSFSLKEVQALIFQDNIRAKRVIEKLGFTYCQTAAYNERLKRNIPVQKWILKLK